MIEKATSHEGSDLSRLRILKTLSRLKKMLPELIFTDTNYELITQSQSGRIAQLLEFTWAPKAAIEEAAIETMVALVIIEDHDLDHMDAVNVATVARHHSAVARHRPTNVNDDRDPNIVVYLSLPN
jgi:hypothetical protein